MIWIVIITFFIALQDILKNSFDNSIFKRFKGNSWWDLRVAELKYHNMNLFIYRIYILFGDAYHLSKTLLVLSIILALKYFVYTAYSTLSHIIFLFVIYGITYELSRLVLLTSKFKLK